MLDEMLDFFKVLNEKKQMQNFYSLLKMILDLVFSKAKQKGISKEKLIIQPSSRELMPSYIGVSDFSIFLYCPFFQKKHPPLLKWEKS